MAANTSSTPYRAKPAKKAKEPKMIKPPEPRKPRKPKPAISRTNSKTGARGATSAY